MALAYCMVLSLAIDNSTLTFANLDSNVLNSTWLEPLVNLELLFTIGPGNWLLQLNTCWLGCMLAKYDHVHRPSDAYQLGKHHTIQCPCCSAILHSPYSFMSMLNPTDSMCIQSQSKALGYLNQPTAYGWFQCSHIPIKTCLDHR